MKSKLNLIASVSIPFLYILFYVWNTAGSTVFRDDMYLIKGAVIEKFCSGTLTFSDLWRPSGGSRMLGYNLLQVANTAWCGLNSRLVVLLIPFVLLATACLLYRDYHRSMAGLRAPNRIAATYALLMLLLFNLTLWEGLTFDYAIIFVWSVPWFLASFYTLEHVLLDGGWNSWLLGIITTSLAVLVFGQTSSFAFYLALITTSGCYVALNRKNLPKGIGLRALACAAVMALIAFLYLFRIKANDYFPGMQYVDWRVFAHPWDLLRFILATLAASIVGADAVQPDLGPNAISALGLLVAVLYAWALMLYFKTRMHEKSYLPLFMIAYALAFVAAMTMGRFRYGLLYGMAPRYVCNTICGIIAITWIFLFAQARRGSATGPLKLILRTAMVLIFAGVGWTSVVEWQAQASRKESYERLSEIARNVDNATDEELALFEERPSLVRESLRVLRKYQLNVYRHD